MNIPNLRIDTVNGRLQMAPDFNWIAILKDLRAGAPINSIQLGVLKHLAANWPTCACGQLCSNLPRHETGSPKDTALLHLGRYFFEQILEQNWSEALRAFYMIEARTTALLEGNAPDFSAVWLPPLTKTHYIGALKDIIARAGCAARTRALAMIPR